MTNSRQIQAQVADQVYRQVRVQVAAEPGEKDRVHSVNSS